MTRTPRVVRDTHNPATYYDGIGVERCRRCLRVAADCTCDPPVKELPDRAERAEVPVA